MIKGAASVKAINPSLAVVTSGVSDAVTLTADADGEDELVDAVLEPELQPCIIMLPAAVAPAVIKNLRLDRFDMRDEIL
jgi:hypothetical protein